MESREGYKNKIHSLGATQGENPTEISGAGEYNGEALKMLKGSFPMDQRVSVTVLLWTSPESG